MRPSFLASSPRPQADLLVTFRLSGFTLLLALTFAFFYLWRVVRFSLGVRRLWEMHEFYTELLDVPEVSRVFF